MTSSSPGPVEVVDDNRSLHPRQNRETALPATRTFSAQAGDDLAEIEVAFLILVAGIADQSSRAANEQDGPMSSPLKAPQCKQRHKVADLETVRRRIEAAIDDAWARREMRLEARFVRNLRDQSSLCADRPGSNSARMG